jgi:serine protease
MRKRRLIAGALSMSVAVTLIGAAAYAGVPSGGEETPGCAGGRSGQTRVDSRMGGPAGGCVKTDEVTLSRLRAPRPSAAHAATQNDGVGRFSSLSTETLWQHMGSGRATAVVGLKALGDRVGVRQGMVLLNRKAWTAAKDVVSAMDGVTVVSADSLRPAMTVKLANLSALARIRRSGYVEYVEPGGFAPQVPSSGCTGNDWNADPEGGDTYTGGYETVSPNDMLPLNFNASRIQEAWNSRGARGQGVTVGLLDTGSFTTQSQLHSQFATGSSGGRFVQHFNTSVDTNPWDSCNHGTRSASTIAAPRDGVNTVGVAWKANLVSVKVGNDVFTDAWETNDVVRGIRQAVSSGARVIALEFATGSWEYDNIRQEIQYQYNKPNNPVLFVGAAGTLYCLEGIMFPAKMPEVVAATGTNYAGELHPEACGGPEVDIAAVINDAFAAGRYPHNLITFGGSSAATAIVAGTAALIWSRYPTWTRDQVLSRLLSSGASATRYGGVGFGIANAYKAVGGFAYLWIVGPTTVEPGTQYTLSASPAGDGPFTYRWSTGQTTPEINLTAGVAGTAQTVSVTVTDTYENKSLTKTIRVVAKKDPICTPRLCP